MTKPTRLRTTLSATTILAAGLMLAATPASAQNLPDTNSVTSVTRGLSGGAPGSTNPSFTTSGAPGAQTLRVDLKDNRTILNWGGTGFDIAAGNTVDFKDARAASGVSGRTDNIAVLNRDLTSSMSNIYGQLRSDPNVSVYLINSSGIVLHQSGSVNVGSLLLSSLNPTNDNDFLNGSAALRFSSTANQGGIDVRGSIRANAAPNSSTNGGRLGDIVILGQGAVVHPGATIEATGDLGIVAARDITLQSAPGSPLSFVVQNAPVSTQIGFHGAATARNILMGTSYGGNLVVPGTLVATGAAVTDRGVVLATSASAPGISIPSAVTDLALNTNGGTITSAKDIHLASYGSTNTGKLTAAGVITFPEGGPHLDLHGRVVTLNTYGAITADRIVLRTTANFHELLKITGGGLSFNVAGDLAFFGGMDIAGDLIGRSETFQVRTRDVKITGSVDMATTGHQFWEGNIQIGGSALLATTGTDTSFAIAGNIVIGDAFTDPSTSNTNFNVGGNLTISNPGIATLRSNIALGGNLEINAGNAIRFSDGGAPPQIKAAGSILLKSGSGGILAGRAAVVQSNSDGIGDEAVTLETTGLIDTAAKFMGGPASQSDVRVRWAGNQAFRIGSVVARNFHTAIGAGAFGSSLSTPFRVYIRELDITNAFSVTGSSVVAENLRVRGGDLSLHATNGEVSASSVIASGGLDLRAEPPTGVFQLGRIQVTDLRSGGDAIVRGRQIEITNSAITGSLTLESTNSSLLGNNIFGRPSGNNVIGGDLNIVGGNELVLRDNVRAGGNVSLSANMIHLGSFSGTARQIATGKFKAVAQVGDINLLAGLSLGGSEIVLATPAALKNLAGANVMSSAGRWLIYSANPAGDTFGGLNSNNTAIWNATLATRDPSTITGNRYVFAQQPKLTFSTVDFSKIYGTDLTGSTSIPFAVSGYHPGVAGAFLGDTAATAFTGNPLIQSAGFAERASVAGGPYAQAIAQGSLQGASGYGFVFAPSTGLVSVTPKAITGSIAADSKIYDGTVTGTGTVSLNGVVTGDTVGTTGSIFTFADKNAGTGKTVAVTGTTLTGADSGNYTLTIPASALADILKKALTLTATANSKVYDGTTAATGSVSLNGVVAGETVGTTGSVFTFADKNAGIGKTVAVTGTTLSGSDAGNYTLTVPASALADILKKAITGSITADNKIYDGTAAGSGSVSLEGVIAGDTVGTTGSIFTFADKNAGTGKTVAVTGTTLSGADAGNYTLTLPASALADILKKAIIATVTANGKAYDGTTAATGSVSLNGVVSGDSVSTGGITFTFADKDAGTGKAVAVGGTLSGADVGNYTVNLPATVLADILKKALTATASANGKTYDGTTAATGSVSLNGVVSGDSVSTGGITFTFADKNAGTGKAVAVGGTLSGTDAGNYTVSLPATVLADIAKRGLSVSAGNQEKYTGDSDPALTYTITLGSLLSGDQLTGALARAAGEAPGDYAIGQGSLSAGGNYSITFTPGTLTITVNPATNQPQTLRAVPLPSGIQAPPSSTGSGVSIDTNALCGEDKSCAGS